MRLAWGYNIKIYLTVYLMWSKAYSLHLNLVPGRTWTDLGLDRRTLLGLGQASSSRRTPGGAVERIQLKLTSSGSSHVRQATVYNANLYARSTGGAAFGPLRPSQLWNSPRRTWLVFGRCRVDRKRQRVETDTAMPCKVNSLRGIGPSVPRPGWRIGVILVFFLYPAFRPTVVLC